MADVDRSAKIEMCDNRGRVGGGIGHVMTARHLIRATVSSSIHTDDSESVAQKEKHLVIPVIARERPTVMKHDRLGVLRSPILEEDVYSVFCRHIAHSLAPIGTVECRRFCGLVGSSACAIRAIVSSYLNNGAWFGICKNRFTVGFRRINPDRIDLALEGFCFGARQLDLAIPAARKDSA